MHRFVEFCGQSSASLSLYKSQRSCSACVRLPDEQLIWKRSVLFDDETTLNSQAVNKIDKNISINLSAYRTPYNGMITIFRYGVDNSLGCQVHHDWTVKT